MKSIRWSLLLYFLVVLALAMGAVSVLAYQRTQESVLKQQKAAILLLNNQHGDNIQKERKKLDDHLLSKAQNLVSLAQFQFNSAHARFRATVQVGQFIECAGGSPCLTAGGMMQSFMLMYQTATGPFGEALHRNNFAELQFDEQELFRDADDAVNEYFQVNSNFGHTSWRSHSMKDLSFPVNPAVFLTQAQVQRYFSVLLLSHGHNGPLDALPALLPALALRLEELPQGPPSWSEDKELEPGHVVRCVTLKAPVATLNFRQPGQPWRQSGANVGGGGRSEPPRPGGPSERPYFMFYVQCASETSERDRLVAALDVRLQEKLAEVDEESRSILAALRTYLLLIALASFATAMVGGYLLIRLGLSPLHRVSDAVSKVSAKDFRLPLDDRPLPVELLPIVDRLTQTLDQLKQAFAREKQAAADISHELRTPVAALMTTAEVALRKPRSAAEYREVIVDCLATSRQMSRLVERLLALARLDAGVDMLQTCEVDVASLAEECVDMVRPLATAQQLRLELHRNGALPVRTDPDKLREVLTNLLHNAIQYNRPHGSVELTVERQNGHLELEVRDTGIGITPEAREHIFERFYRADPSRHADSMNAGLGLAIVKGYIDLLGGTITVESTVGAGTSFRVELPAEERSSAIAARPQLV